MFDNGPWRDTFVRMGYDPRLDKADRMSATILFGASTSSQELRYQRLYFRNTANEITKKSIVAAKKKGKPVGDDTGTPEGRDMYVYLALVESETADLVMQTVTYIRRQGVTQRYCRFPDVRHHGPTAQGTDRRPGRRARDGRRACLCSA